MPTEVWRCTDAQGHRIYSQQPCPQGQALTGVDDPRTASQRRAATDALARDQALGRKMARDRQHFERQADGQSVIRLRHKPPASGATPPTDPHAPIPLEPCRAPDCFRAKGPKTVAGKSTSSVN